MFWNLEVSEYVVLRQYMDSWHAAEKKAAEKAKAKTRRR